MALSQKHRVRVKWTFCIILLLLQDITLFYLKPCWVAWLHSTFQSASECVRDWRKLVAWNVSGVCEGKRKVRSCSAEVMLLSALLTTLGLYPSPCRGCQSLPHLLYYTLIPLSCIFLSPIASLDYQFLLIKDLGIFYISCIQ